ncbi:MAG: hypothetical protein HDT35_06815 [Clostridiales bacterium]|nr:hypothetical protein [Clostridiales bacterium]
MVNLKRIYFGCSDADTEADRNPLAFQKSFFDPHEHMDELINGDRFILRGRKGDGKTAYSAQIRLTAPNNNIYAHQRSLNNFNNSTFLQIKTYDNLGGNPYISFWKCVLLIECVGMIYMYEPHIQTDGFVNIVAALNDCGFLAVDNDISITITKLVETNSMLTIKSVFQHNRKYAKENELRGAEQIYTAIRNSIQNIYLNKKFVLIIDGLDDILNNSEFKSEIITGLIRAVEEINRVFKKTTLSIKIIILIRDDILNLCRDPNLSKIIRDSGIRLSWTIPGNPYDSDLIKLVSKRIDEVAPSENSFEQMWQDVFPDFIGSKPSLEYVLENIIYRPRDILQFFIEIQKEFVPGKKLTTDKLQTALARYSEEYFIEAMRDELTGFFPDEVVTMLPDILSKMGMRYFYLSEFEEECSKYAEFNSISPQGILEKLFNAGYIGQHRPRAQMDYTVFSYRNPRESFQAEHECIVHRGLTRALTIF